MITTFKDEPAKTYQQCDTCKHDVDDNVGREDIPCTDCYDDAHSNNWEEK